MRKLKFLSLIMIAGALVCCKGNKHKGENPLMYEWDTPFGIPPFDEIKPEHFKPAYKEAMKRHNAEIEAIVENKEAPGFDNVLLAYDQSGIMLSTVSSVFERINGADSNEELRAIEKEMSPVLTLHYDNINMNEGLFAKIKAVYEKRDALGLNPIQSRLLDKTYEKFVRAGANLPFEGKEKLKEINGAISAEQVKFKENLLAANRKFVLMLDEDDVRSLPQDIRDAAAELAAKKGEEGRYAFTLSKPSLLPFLTYCDKGELREKLYKGYLDRCNYDDPTDNRAIINEIVRLRIEKAHLLGYKSHADFMLRDRMAKEPANVYALLNDLWTPALARAKGELEEMKAIKKQETGSDKFDSWDWWFYAEKLRKQKYNLDEEQLRPYFSLENVRQGIFDLSNRLYGITFRPINVPLYNEECMAYEVLDKDNSHLAVIILDMHPREGKRVGAWCAALTPRRFIGGERIDPIVTVVCNFTRPVGSRPAMLTLDEVETFFHEFGHALHNFFNMSPYRGVASVERDFVELPSQIMENWATEPQMLRSYALHYQNKNTMPENLIKRLVNSGHFNQGFNTTENLAASFLDMDIHTIENYKQIDINEYERAQLQKLGAIPQVEPRYRYPYFNHVFPGGYSAGYYSYKWAEVLDKDAYEAFVESGDIFNRAIATRFRDEILSKGGTEDGMTMYVNFRGREPRREPLLYALGLLEKPEAADVPTPTAVNPE